MTMAWQCEHAATAVWTAQLSVRDGAGNPGQATMCRECVLGLTGYPQELTRTLDAVIVGKRFGRLEMTVQNGVPGVVRFDDTLKVESWQPWPRKNWLTQTIPDGK